VSTSLTTLSTTLEAIVPGGSLPTKYTRLTTDGDAVTAMLNMGAEMISATTSISLVDALGLVTDVQVLAAAGNNSINVVIAKAPILIADGAAPGVLEQLEGQREGTRRFGDAFVGKLPVSLRAFAGETTGLAVANVERAIVVF
ncbi:hypothetical protein K402DRAFT_309982, partial [Aulographum hederae CBS 113979]